MSTSTVPQVHASDNSPLEPQSLHVLTRTPRPDARAQEVPHAL
jgi:hypothetical protein